MQFIIPNPPRVNFALNTVISQLQVPGAYSFLQTRVGECLSLEQLNATEGQPTETTGISTNTAGQGSFLSTFLSFHF